MGKVLTEDEKELLTEEVPPQVAGMLLCMLYGVIVGIAFGLLIGLNWK
jgi:tetrahydromethanopterin S-methyltransferase subunit B